MQALWNVHNANVSSTWFWQGPSTLNFSLFLLCCSLIGFHLIQLWSYPFLFLASSLLAHSCPGPFYWIKKHITLSFPCASSTTLKLDVGILAAFFFFLTELCLTEFTDWINWKPQQMRTHPCWCVIRTTSTLCIEYKDHRRNWNISEQL
jgi:predicted PurR-regulated permease PerM